MEGAGIGKRSVAVQLTKSGESKDTELKDTQNSRTPESKDTHIQKRTPD
jgi:hypothetical protein